jgi:hypothetical protein
MKQQVAYMKYILEQRAGGVTVPSRVLLSAKKVISQSKSED